MKEKYQNEATRVLVPLAISSLTALSLVSLMANAFTTEIRDKIKDRCHNNSELDPRFKGNIFKLQAMHIDHRREMPWYNDPNNGIMGTVGQHHSNLIGGIFNKDGSFNPGGVDHSIFFRPDMREHFTESAIKMFIDKYGSTQWLWKYALPKWDDKGRAVGDELGTLSRPATAEERTKGICRVEVPLKLNRKGMPSDNMKFIKFEDIYENREQMYSSRII